MVNLNCSANNIHRIEEIKALHKCTSLESLTIKENPLAFPPAQQLDAAEEDQGSDVVCGDDVGEADRVDEDDIVSSINHSVRKVTPSVPLTTTLLEQHDDTASVRLTQHQHQQLLRMKVIALLPQLRNLDATPVTVEEMVKAKLYSPD